MPPFPPDFHDPVVTVMRPCPSHTRPSIRRARRVGRAAALLLTMGALGASLGCGGDETQAAAPGAARGPSGPGPARPDTPVGVDRVHVGPASSYYTATATLEADNRAEIQSRASGVVTRILSEEGDRVKAGAVLLQLDDAEARFRVQQAQANLEAAKSDHERRSAMMEGGLLSEGEFETTENTLSVREAELGLAQVALSYTQVKTPFDGRVVRRFVDLGANVSTGTPLFSVMDDDPLLARIHIPAKRMSYMDVGQPLEIQVDSQDKELTGVVRLISPIVDPTTGTVKVTAEIRGATSGVRPGDFAQVRIVTARHEDAMLVPSGAVFEEQGQQVLYVAVDGKAVRRVVETGFVDGDNTEILSGLEPQELVVVKGQRQLRDGGGIEILEGPEDVLAAETARREAAGAESGDETEPETRDAS